LSETKLKVLAKNSKYTNMQKLREHEGNDKEVVVQLEIDKNWGKASKKFPWENFEWVPIRGLEKFGVRNAYVKKFHFKKHEKPKQKLQLTLVYNALKLMGEESGILSLANKFNVSENELRHFLKGHGKYFVVKGNIVYTYTRWKTLHENKEDQRRLEKWM